MSVPLGLALMIGRTDDLVALCMLCDTGAAVRRLICGLQVARRLDVYMSFVRTRGVGLIRCKIKQCSGDVELMQSAIAAGLCGMCCSVLRRLDLGESELGELFGDGLTTSARGHAMVLGVATCVNTNEHLKTIRNAFVSCCGLYGRVRRAVYVGSIEMAEAMIAGLHLIEASVEA